MIAEPLVAVDRVLSLHAGGIEAEKHLSANELVFAGHYPNFPIYPGVFLLETMLQSIGRWADSCGATLAFMGVKTLRLFAPALPGDVVLCICTRKGEAEGPVVFDAVCSAAGRTLAKAVVEFAAARECPR